MNTWQCDENDHLNVQFYTEFGHEASAHLLHQLGFGPRAQRAAGATIRIADDHIRYLREFRVIDSVEVRSAPVEVGERELTVYHEVRNPADGTVASTIRRRIVERQALARRVARARRAGPGGAAGERAAAQRRHARPARPVARAMQRGPA